MRPGAQGGSPGGVLELPQGEAGTGWAPQLLAASEEDDDSDPGQTPLGAATLTLLRTPHSPFASQLKYNLIRPPPESTMTVVRGNSYCKVAAKVAENYQPFAVLSGLLGVRYYLQPLILSLEAS